MKKNGWLDIDKEGLRKSLGQKNKVFLLTEMVSNAWDEDITKVEVTLTRPDEKSHSWLHVIDNSPTGWSDLSHAHTMFAESTKKAKSEKRGRFNAGEKDVLALAIEAKLTTVKGQVLFNEDGTRTEGTETREVGSEFAGRFQLTQEEYENIVQQAKLLIPPKGIITMFNGEEIPYRKPNGSFTETLPIPLADKEGVMRNVERKTKVNLYERLPGEVAMIYEMGIPIVELGDDKWHVNVMQKVPPSRDRDNVNPSYLRKIRVAVLNAKFEELKDEESAAATWVRDAVGSSKSSDAAVKHVMTTRFGQKHVTRDVRDKGSANEAVSQGHKIVEGGSMTGREWERYKAIKDENGESVLKTSAQVAPTDVVGPLTDSLIIPRKDWTAMMHGYAAMVEAIAPNLIGKPVVIQFIDNENVHIEGCFQNGFRGDRSTKGYTRDFGIMTVNLAYTDVDDNEQKYTLLLHELAHDKVCSNDHLHHEFYGTVEVLGGKLAVLIQDDPELFDIGVHCSDFADVQPPWAVAHVYEHNGEGVAAARAVGPATGRSD
jgi:hypothetical protein